MKMIVMNSKNFNQIETENNLLIKKKILRRNAQSGLVVIFSLIRRRDLCVESCIVGW